MAKKPGKGRAGAPSGPHGGQRLLRKRVKTARGRKLASTLWLERQLNDPYVAAAKRDGYRSRAAYKLTEIDDKYQFLKPGQVVLDLGAAPGGWSQVAAKRCNSGDGANKSSGQVVALDYLEVEPLAGVELIRKDFMDDDAEEALQTLLRDGEADVVLSDMAAPTVGHSRTDHLRIMALAEAAADFACRILRPGGTYLCKVFQGGAERDLLQLLKTNFKTVRHIKPPASRKDSAELYVLATGFRGRKAEDRSEA
jgi:23S rRNA (uridine2552-2'-O)-methyltransferase